MDILPILGIALVAAVLVVLLRQYKPEFALPVEICAAVLILALLIPTVTDIFHSLRDLIDLSGMDVQYFSLLVKAVGITVIVQLTADACRDSGETALAHKVEFAGRAAVILMILPMLAAVAEFAIGLIEG